MAIVVASEINGHSLVLKDKSVSTLAEPYLLIIHSIGHCIAQLVANLYNIPDNPNPYHGVKPSKIRRSQRSIKEEPTHLKSAITD